MYIRAYYAEQITCGRKNNKRNRIAIGFRFHAF